MKSMDAIALREALQRRPFHPFILRLADGRELYVPYPQIVGLKGGGWLAVAMRTSDVALMGPEQIEGIETKESLMVIEAIREAVRRQPFRPFVLRLVDGRQVTIAHPELLAIAGRTVIVTNATDESYSILEPLLILSIEYEGRPAQPATEPHTGDNS